MEALKTAIVTGASAGLGRAFAEEIARNRRDIDEIWLVARRRERLEEFAAEHPGRRFRIIAADLSTEAGISAVEDALRERGPAVSLLVNNAGIETDGAFADGDLGRLRAMVRLNAEAPMVLCHLVVPYLASGAGIVNVSSTAGFCPLPGLTAYSATKSFLTAFSEGLRAELKPIGVNVMALCPGNMDTEMNPRERPVGGESGTQASNLPFVDVGLIARRALARCAAGKGFYTPGSFYKAYRLAMKLLPHSAVRAVSPHFF